MQSNDPDLEEQEKPPFLIPEHKLLRIIGKGSYGQVWLAVNSFDTFRAIKIVQRRSFKTSKPFERELSGIRKFEPISRSHSGFIPILQVGCNSANDYFYVVMELADNASQIPFDPESYQPRALQQRSLPISECIKIGISLGEALNYLHQNGLIHRDIKPSNILFVKGSPKLADVGMVADVGDSMSFVGTEGFIPPEGPGTIQADIYSFGKVLYEISTGRDRMDFPAYPEPDGFPEWESFLELNEILIKACQTDKSKRYQTAGDLVSDLKALSAGKSVVRLRRLERQAFLAKRAAIGVLIALSAAAILFIPIYQQIRFKRDERSRQVGRNIAFGVQGLDRGEYFSALPYLQQGFQLDVAGREKTHRVRLSTVIKQGPRLSWMGVEGSPVLHVQFSRDDSRLVTSSLNGSATIYYLDGSQPSFTLQHPALRQACFAADGKAIVTAGADQSVRIWDSSGILLKVFTNDAAIYAVAVSPLGNLIATAGDDGKVIIWDIETGIKKFVLNHAAPVECVSFSPDGLALASGSQDQTSSVWSVETGKRLEGPFKHDSWITGVAFSPDGKSFSTASLDRKVRVWNRATGREIIPAIRHPDGARSVAFSRDGEYLLTGSYDRSARLFDIQSGDLIAPILPQSGRVLDAQFSGDCSRVAVGCWDGSIRVYDLSRISQPIDRGKVVCTADLAQFVRVHENVIEFRDSASDKIIGVANLPENSTPLGIASYSNGSLGVFVGKKGRYIADNGGSVFAIKTDLSEFKSFASNGRLIGLQTTTNIVVFDRSGVMLNELPIPAVTNGFFSFSDKASTLVYWQSTHLQMWDLTNSAGPRWSIECEAPVASVAFSADGNRMVVGEQDLLLEPRTARVLATLDGKLLCPPLKHLDGVLHAEFSPDGKRIVTGSEEFSAFIFNVENGSQVAGPLKHQHQVLWASFSSDSRWVVTASNDKTIRVWEAASGDPVTPSFSYTEPLSRAHFLAEDSCVATLTKSGKLLIWSLDQLPDLEKLIYPIISLESGKPLEHWRASWSDLQQLQAKQSASDLSNWHRNRAVICDASKNAFGHDFHLKFVDR
jgi:WD40 repeat protein